MDSAAQGSWSSVYAANYKPVIRNATVRQQVMPNVRGMGLKDALFLLENMGVRVSVKGKGKVTSQSVSAGEAIAKGASVVLELS